LTAQLLSQLAALLTAPYQQAEDVKIGRINSNDGRLDFLTTDSEAREDAIARCVSRMPGWI
jgi:hypothetical protein